MFEFGRIRGAAVRTRALRLRKHRGLVGVDEAMSGRAVGTGGGGVALSGSGLVGSRGGATFGDVPRRARQDIAHLFGIEVVARLAYQRGRTCKLGSGGGSPTERRPPVVRRGFVSVRVGASGVADVYRVSRLKR
jgi:hypothetical protein